VKDKETLPVVKPEINGISRRNFLKTLTGTAAGIGISQMFNPALIQALEKGLTRHPVIWLQGQGCTGCSVSLLNSVDPSIADILLKVISLQFHPTVGVAEGENAMKHVYAVANEYKGRFSLVIEGSIPVAANGKYCILGEIGHREISMMDLVQETAPMAGSVLAIGTCATYGGIPAAKGNVTGATSVMDFFNKKRSPPLWSISRAARPIRTGLWAPLSTCWKAVFRNWILTAGPRFFTATISMTTAPDWMTMMKPSWP
jgi:hydrogenase small subunit